MAWRGGGWDAGPWRPRWVLRRFGYGEAAQEVVEDGFNVAMVFDVEYSIMRQGDAQVSEES